MPVPLLLSAPQSPRVKFDSASPRHNGSREKVRVSKSSYLPLEKVTAPIQIENSQGVPKPAPGPIALDAHHAASRLGPGCSLEPRCLHAPRTRPHTHTTGRAVHPPHIHHTIDSSTVLHQTQRAATRVPGGKSKATRPRGREARVCRASTEGTPPPPPHLSCREACPRLSRARACVGRPESRDSWRRITDSTPKNAMRGYELPYIGSLYLRL